MRAALSLALAFSGCLVPERSLVCGDSERCEPPHVEAPFVLGKPDGDSNWYTHGLNYPSGVTVQGGMLFVADRENNRILVWKTWPSQSYQPPDLVIGQKQPSVLEGGSLNNSFVGPRCLTGDASRLFVGTDLPKSQGTPEHNRLLQFALPLAQSYPTIARAQNVGAGAGAPGPRNFAGPSPLLVGDTLVVADRQFNRALLWSSANSFAFQDPSYVLGQTNLTSGAAMAASSSSLTAPQGCPASDGTNLVIADTNSNRVLLFGPVSGIVANNQAAKTVLGQADFVSGQPNRGGAPSLATLSGPAGVAVATVGGMARLVVADRDNHRVLLWPTLPSANGMAASRVLGQSDGSTVTANAGGVSLSSLSGPTGVYSDGTRLAVADTENHRVLLWNSWPTANRQPADVVLGQASGSGNVGNGLFATATSFVNPFGLARVGEGLALVDRGAHRVLLWSKLPQRSTDLPDRVLGQADLNGSLAYGGASEPTADGLRIPNRVASDGQSLVVLDGFGFLTRVLIWSRLPTAAKQPADGLLGQPSFRDQFGAGTPLSDFGGDGDIAMFGGRIYVADAPWNRVLIWRSLPTRINQPADVVLGQPDRVSTNANQGGSPAAHTLRQPRGIFVDDGHIYVADSGNHRILVWNTNDPLTNQPADRVIDQASFSDSQGCVAGRLCNPQALAVQGSRLYVTEPGNHRILSWPTTSPQLGEPPERVLGQPDLSTTAPNVGRLALDRLSSPQSIVASDRGLYIADSGNGRIVVLPPIAP